MISILLQLFPQNKLIIVKLFFQNIFQNICYKQLILLTFYSYYIVFNNVQH